MSSDTPDAVSNHVVSRDTTPHGNTASTQHQKAPFGAAPFLSQAEAAKACGVSTATIRRARTDGRLEGCTQNGDGGWRIPIPSLVAAGLLDRTTPPDTVSNRSGSRNTTHRHDTPDTGERHAQDDATALSREIAALQEELADVRRRAEVAETAARERGLALEDLRLAMRALTATAHTTGTVTTARDDRPMPGPEGTRDDVTDDVARSAAASGTTPPPAASQEELNTPNRTEARSLTSQGETFWSRWRQRHPRRAR